MEKIFISFCRAGENIIEKIIKENIKSEFIHVEIIAGNFVYDYSEQHEKNGKKRWILGTRLKSESYRNNINEIFEINIPEGSFQKIFKYIEEYYVKHDYDKNMKFFRIGDFGMGNKDFLKGAPSVRTTICSHFCFEVIKFIVKNYYRGNAQLNYKVDYIYKHYVENLEYITPGYLYEFFSRERELFLD